MSVTREELQAVLSYEDKGFSKGMKNAQKGMDGFNQKGAGMGGVLKKVAGVFATYKIAETVLNVGKKALLSASNVEEMQSKFNTVFGNMAQDVDAWATEFGGAVGRNKNDIKGWLADNQNMFVGMGMTRDAGADLSKKIVSLSLDLASFNNLNEADAVNAMSKALMGESENAKALGAVLNDNTRAMAMEALGYKGKFDALTEAEKMEVRYQAILMQSTDAVGDLERTNGSFANTLKGVQAKFEELLAVIGEFFLPIATQVLTIVGDLTTKFLEWVSSLGGLEENNETLTNFGTLFGEIFGNIRDTITEVVNKVVEFYETNKEKFETIKQIITEAITNIITIIMSFGDTFALVRDTIGTIIGDVIQWFIDLVSSNQDTFTAIWQGIQEAMGAIQQCIQAIWTVISRLWDKHGQTILAFSRTAFNVITVVIRSALTIIKGVFQVITGLISGDWSTMGEGLKNVFRGVWEFISGIARNIKETMINLFKGKIKKPKFSISGDIFKPSTWIDNPPRVQVSWHAKGGVFTKPTVLGNHGFGEAGKEAILPLERIPKLLGLDKNEKAQPIYIYMDGRKVAEGTMPHVAKIMRTKTVFG